ncbi:ABC transporter permease [Sphingobacterium sp. HJSM2_6]|uniref:ABC transporter permease n=1 Tax=Sphingobacterium sp. HJSM2_6 TaxID=3366264 RepID=UPI003BDD5136
MIHSILQYSLRHLFRNKLYTFLNVLGLSIGISSCWVIYKYVTYELSYEEGMAHKEHTYRLISRMGEEGNYSFSGGISAPIYFYMKEELAGIKTLVPVFKTYTQSVFVPEGRGQHIGKELLDFEKQQIFRTEKSYFDLLDYTWLAGNKQTALRHSKEVVLSENRARYYFPDLQFEEMIGKTVLYDDSIQVAISGIVKPLDYPSEFRGEEFMLLEKSSIDLSLANWTNTNSSDMVYFQTNNETEAARILDQVQKKVRSNWELFNQERKVTYNYNREIEKLPILETHFSTEINDFGISKISKKVIYALIGTGVFLLILACINYINLTTALLPQRNKEIGIRKTLGSKGKHLIFQLLMETGWVILLAIIFSIPLSFLAIHFLNEFFPTESFFFRNEWRLFLFMFLLFLLTLLIAGIFPSWMATKVNAVDIFRNKSKIAVGNVRLNIRKLFIIFQFVVAQIFIISAIIIGQQLTFAIQKDLGFKKESVIVSDIPIKLWDSENYDSKRQTLLTELRKIPGIEHVSLGQKPMTDRHSSSIYTVQAAGDKESEGRRIFLKSVDTAYLNVYGIQLIAGANLLPSDTISSFLINESAVKMFQFSSAEDAIGKLIGQGNQRYPIVGVVKDFHISNFYSAIEPTALRTHLGNAGTINIRLASGSFQAVDEVMGIVKNKWSQFFPVEDFTYEFMDKSIASLYKKEHMLLTLTNLCTVIAVIISCLGLFGLATISAYQRSKEIGIRKVLGASISKIFGLLSKDYLNMVFIALIIASPIVWWLANSWLADFAYRIDISWVPFLIGGTVIFSASILTISYQAMKAARSNPVESLRDE